MFRGIVLLGSKPGRVGQNAKTQYFLKNFDRNRDVKSISYESSIYFFLENSEMIRFTLSAALVATLFLFSTETVSAQGPFRLRANRSNSQGFMANTIARRQNRLGGSFMEPERRQRRLKIMGTLLSGAAAGLSGYASSGALSYSSPSISGGTAGGGFNANRAMWSSQRASFNRNYSWNPNHFSANGLR